MPDSAPDECGQPGTQRACSVVPQRRSPEAVSGAGDGIFWVALVVFLADQPQFGLWLTIAVIARLAPRALLSLPAGSLVDRSNLRRLIVSIECSRAALMATLAVMVSRDVGAPVVLLIIAVSYTVAAPTRPALSAVVPAIAGERHLAVANAVLSTIRQVMTFVGPLLGVVVALLSPSAGFVVTAATFAVSGAILATVRRIPHRARSERGAEDGEPFPARRSCRCSRTPDRPRRRCSTASPNVWPATVEARQLGLIPGVTMPSLRGRGSQRRWRVGYCHRRRIEGMCDDRG